MSSEGETATPNTTPKQENYPNLNRGGLSATNQPDPIKKKEGRERKKQAQEIMDRIGELQRFTLTEIQEMMSKDKLPHLTVREIICLEYIKRVMKWNLLVDFLDRHISKAPQDIRLGWGLQIKQVNFLITDETETQPSDDLPQDTDGTDSTGEINQETGPTT